MERQWWENRQQPGPMPYLVQPMAGPPQFQGQQPQMQPMVQYQQTQWNANFTMQPNVGMYSGQIPRFQQGPMQYQVLKTRIAPKVTLIPGLDLD